MPKASATHLLKTLFVALVFVAAAGPSAQAKGKRDLALEEGLRKQSRSVKEAHCRRLDKIVKWCVKEGLKAEGERQVAVIESYLEDWELLAKHREKLAALGDKEASAAQKDKLARKIEKANAKNAKDLFGLAKKCMKVGLFSAAYDMINAVILANPDHTKARKVLGYKLLKSEKRWITNWEFDQRKKHVLFEDDGWVLKKNLKKWKQGLRPFAGEWVTVEREREKRLQNEYRAWEVEAEHVVVKTNLGRAKGYEFAMLLEDFYRTFFRVFIGFFDQAKGAKLLFNRAKLKSKHLVYFYPSRADYLTHVKAEHGNDQLLKESAGFYTGSGDRCSHFYMSGDEEDTLSTTYHEFTHQLFAETKVNSGGSKGNNWVSEGIASYTETWVKRDGKWYPGENAGIDRMKMAKQYLASGKFDLMSFIKIDHDGFHDKANGGRLRGLHYALACALSHFLMHYDGERYKEDFVQLISAYYGGKLRPDSFASYIHMEGVDGDSGKIAALQKQFLGYMANLDI